MRLRYTLVPAAAFTLLLVGAIKIFVVSSPSPAEAGPSDDVIRLRGVVHDFRPDHPDFDLTGTSVTGHCVRNVHPLLGPDGRPEHIAAGRTVVEQWYDKNNNPIMPYASDPGLPGGHFDVDVFDELSTKERYHEHQFDDKFDVTYVDIAHDPKLLFNDIVGPGYPNNLRVEFINPHHGSGNYVFEAAGVHHQGRTRDGFTATFDPAMLTTFRIDFASLWDLRGTKPGTVQDDMGDRDDSLSVRMFDVTTGELAYELAIYHHVKEGEDSSSSGGGFGGGNDACGAEIRDRFGRLQGICPGGIQSEDSFSQWYRTALGTNLSKLHMISLYRNADGVYEYLTDDFFPIDGELLATDGEPHNNFFTYTISATFTHAACTGLFFEFEGNDDCWVFIDGRLVMDLGGTNTPSRQYVALDRLDLDDGREYRLDFFFAQRRDTGNSVFRMRTNICLATRGSVPVSGGYD